MRRLLVLFPVLIALVAWAAVMGANNHVAGSGDSPIIVEPPQEWIGEAVKVTDLPPAPRRPDAAPAADTCGEATPLQLSFANTADGSGTITNLFSQEATDPALACMFGDPTNPQGYRTAWYQLVAGDTSVVTLTTEGTNYDTVLGVFAGTCDALLSLSLIHI